MADRSEWPRRSHAVSELLLPRHYGSVPTVFGAPKATVDDMRGADVAFIGIPWQAPVPDSRIGAAGANYFGTSLTPHTFRTNSVKYTGYLPERDIDVFDAMTLVDCGDVAIDPDLPTTFDTVATTVERIIRAGAIPVTCGGNSGPSTYAVVKGVGAAADGPVAVFNFDAHGDNRPGRMEDDDPAMPTWGGTWALRTLDLPNVDPSRYVHIGLRGPRNDAGTISRFLDKGVQRARIFTYDDIARARRRGYEEWAAEITAPVLDGAAKAWIVVDPDALDMSVSPDFGDEPLGMYAEELCWSCYQIGKAAGRDRLGGIAFTAIPYDAMTIHWILMYAWLYTLAGVGQSDRA